MSNLLINVSDSRKKIVAANAFARLTSFYSKIAPQNPRFLFVKVPATAALYISKYCFCLPVGVKESNRIPCGQSFILSLQCYVNFVLSDKNSITLEYLLK